MRHRDSGHTTDQQVAELISRGEQRTALEESAKLAIVGFTGGVGKRVLLVISPSWYFILVS